MDEEGSRLVRIEHGFLQHPIDRNAETVIIGTFNPGRLCGIEFFYSGPRNRIWRLLPTAFGEPDLRKASPETKIEFSRCKLISFIDIISEVEVEEDKRCCRDDKYIDCRVRRWRNVISELQNLPFVKRVCFTRKTFNDVPHIRKKVENIKEHFGPKFRLMSTPTRTPHQTEQEAWTKFLREEPPPRIAS